MCDYSLNVVPNRLAQEGEHLVVHRFCTGTIGLAPETTPPTNQPSTRSWWRMLTEWLIQPNDTETCAVCVPPGARLLLRDIPSKTQKQFQISASAEVTFTQVGELSNTHRDSVRFGNGRTLSVQKLRPGQRAKVLSLSLADDVQTPQSDTMQSWRAPASTLSPR